MLGVGGLAGPLGRASLLVGLVGAVFGVLAAVVGTRRRDTGVLGLAPRFAVLCGVAATGAFACMEWAMITRDFSLAYVQKVGSWSTPALFNFAAVWSALEGSILLWLLVLTLLTVGVVVKYRTKLDDPMVGWGLAVLFVVGVFFFVLTLGPANPFAAGPPGVLDGPGPNPLLQNHVLVMFHPPVLYIGYVGFTVPFAFAIGALVTGRVGEGWLLETRRWALLSWGFLTFGIILGSWWSYEVLGWGGVWAWDPVENASFLPWLTGTAYIHSVLVQERRGMLRVWNLSLLVATFSLTILGTFLTRSGVLNSVHAFSDSNIGPYLLTFFALIVLVSVVLIGWRGDLLRSPGTIDSPVSREGAFLANNVVFSVFAFVVLLGTVFPLVVEALQNRQLVVGEPFFDRLGVPVGLTLLFLMCVAPVLPWRKASGELLAQRLFWPAWGGTLALLVAVLVGGTGFAPLLTFFLGGFASGAALRQLLLATRRQGWRGLVGRANGGMVVHIGVILVAVALAASNSHTRSQELDLRTGEAIEWAGHTFELTGFRRTVDDRQTRIAAVVLVDGTERAPAITKFVKMGQNIGTPSVLTSLTKDIYLTLESPVRMDSGRARVKVFMKPMIVWIWIGGALMVLGTVLAMFPGRRRRPTDPVSAPVPATAGRNAGQ
ncbi:MAG: cytochrome c-type biosis protein CcmF [Actinomycetota bacterium]